MKVDPKTISVLAIYRNYRNGKYKVNRAYQRKLVWSIDQKSKLIESILNSYPVPLIFLVEKEEHFEILDGLQRLNAIVSFIENEFSVNIDGKEYYFDVSTFPFANDLEKGNIFNAVKEIDTLLSANHCLNLLNYEIPITILNKATDLQITDVFSRINSYGKQLSAQEKRQAGVDSKFSSLVRSIASDLRGDISEEIVDLTKLPSISTTSKREKTKKYLVIAENTFWVKQGILDAKGLKDGKDEELLADICASILLKEPFKYSKENLDKLYEPKNEQTQNIERLLVKIHGYENLRNEVKRTISVIQEILNVQKESLKEIVRADTGATIRQPFYVIFMAFYKLLIIENKIPDNYKEIINALRNSDKNIIQQAHHANIDEREKNITWIYSLITKYFYNNTNINLHHGFGLYIDIQHMLIRSEGGESRLYELKQGLYDTDGDRSLNQKLLYEKIPKSLSAIANAAQGKSEGYFIIGVSESINTTKTIEKNDGILADEIGKVFVVGINREIKLQSNSKGNNNIDAYMKSLITAIDKAPLPQEFKVSIIANIEHVNYKEKTIIVIKIPKQNNPIFYNDCFYIRKDSSNIQITSPSEILAYSNLFKNS